MQTHCGFFIGADPCDTIDDVDGSSLCMKFLGTSFFKSLLICAAFVGAFFLLRFEIMSAQTVKELTADDLVDCAPQVGSESGTFKGLLPPNGTADTDALFVNRTFAIECWNKFHKSEKEFYSTANVTATIPPPDLTANPPVITCEEWARLGVDENGIQKCHKNSMLTISGSVSNLSGSATVNGTFVSIYQYSTDGRVWHDRAETFLVESTPVSMGDSSRVLTPYAGTKAKPWVVGYSPASDHYWHFRVCADSKNEITETNETNNCSRPTLLKVLALKPDAALWISRTSEKCGELKQKRAFILKGERAILCWVVMPVAVYE